MKGLENDILGHSISEVESAKRAEQTLHSPSCGPADETACNHEAALPFESGYACAYCHTDLTLSDTDEVWVCLKNGLVKVEIENRGLGDLFG